MTSLFNCPFMTEENKEETSKTKRLHSHKNTISFQTNFLKLEKNYNLVGDRFIPFKNTKDNVQSYLLNNLSHDNYIKQKNINNDIYNLSPIDEKLETNYANFIVDNMLRKNSDQFNLPESKIRKFRDNPIFTFSRKVSFDIIQNKNEKNENNNHIFDNSTKKLYQKSSSGKRNKNQNKNIEIDNNNIINTLFSTQNFDNTFQRNSLLTKLCENNKRSVLPDPNFILANYSNNNSLKRNINLTPEKILDAPNLVDDFYLNLLDWGKFNLAVALSNEIYIWNSDTQQTFKLMSISENENYENNISSINWMNNGIVLGIGLPNGNIQLWDSNKIQLIREIKNAHQERVTCLSWNGYNLSSGSKDKFLKIFDVRNQNSEIFNIKQHKQEICSLKYSYENDLLSSGGNDNIAYIWDVRKLNNKLLSISNNNNFISSQIKPSFINNFHNAAIKAMAWCPWQRHVLATGGGTKDKTIKIVNCDTSKIIKNVETGSQVCAILWNKKEKEIISSHGYNKNQITIWNYQKMKKICELKGHMNRVLYLTMSPDNNYICSGSGDETLRFWKINEDIKEEQNEDDQLALNVQIH